MGGGSSCGITDWLDLSRWALGIGRQVPSRIEARQEPQKAAQGLCGEGQHEKGWAAVGQGRASDSPGLPHLSRLLLGGLEFQASVSSSGQWADAAGLPWTEEKVVLVSKAFSFHGPHFTDEEMEAQRGPWPTQSQQARSWSLHEPPRPPAWDRREELPGKPLPDQRAVEVTSPRFWGGLPLLFLPLPCPWVWASCLLPLEQTC